MMESNVNEPSVESGITGQRQAVQSGVPRRHLVRAEDPSILRGLGGQGDRADHSCW